MRFGFSYVGFIYLVMLLVPNLIWAKNKPGDYALYAKNENKPGDHMIYEQKPVECGRIVRDFIDGLDQ